MFVIYQGYICLLVICVFVLNALHKISYETKIFFYDAQSGEFVDIKEYANLESFEVLKVDKLLLNRDLLLKISQLI